MRVYSLTLRVDNLPEMGKRQYERMDACLSTPWRLIANGTKRHNGCRFFRKTKCKAHSHAAQHR